MSTPITKEALIERGFKYWEFPNGYGCRIGEYETGFLRCSWFNSGEFTVTCLRSDKRDEDFFTFKNCTTMEQINTLIEVCI